MWPDHLCLTDFLKLRWLDLWCRIRIWTELKMTGMYKKKKNQNWWKDENYITTLIIYLKSQIKYLIQLFSSYFWTLCNLPHCECMGVLISKLKHRRTVYFYWLIFWCNLIVIVFPITVKVLLLSLIHHLFP